MHVHSRKESCSRDDHAACCLGGHVALCAAVSDAGAPSIMVPHRLHRARDSRPHMLWMIHTVNMTHRTWHFASYMQEGSIRDPVVEIQIGASGYSCSLDQLNLNCTQ